MSTFQVNGVALITGGGSGIGRDCGIAFALEGARGVVFADLNLVAAQESAKLSEQHATHPDFRALALAVDVVDIESVKKMVADSVDAFDRIDYCINSAGIGVIEPRDITDLTTNEFDRFIAVNVRGSLHCIQEVSKVMRQQTPVTIKGRSGDRDIGRGAIVNLGSVSSFIAVQNVSPYTISKHAVIGLTKSAALDNVAHGIRVNAVCPSWTDTPMMDAVVAETPILGKIIPHVIPMGRLTKAEEVSDVIIFLCSPRSSFVTGGAWIVDGGATMMMPF